MATDYVALPFTIIGALCGLVFIVVAIGFFPNSALAQRVHPDNKGLLASNKALKDSNDAILASNEANRALNEAILDELRTHSRQSELQLDLANLQVDAIHEVLQTLDDMRH
ncbi:uncharacterized protein RAG0_14947 [Rhynchosporium agropyri]|uniref:Uncharacterized protein n=1 Tax=Rhynchosporium agropyri TaxID=914238 RepID=A0A1E1LJ21_9HELO|nr:uncharacterized protein RAG0_14947 [Rhynchosporium agropyri]